MERFGEWPNAEWATAKELVMNNVVAFQNRPIEITVSVSDPEVVHELEKREVGGEREAFAGQALRLGVLAIRQASGSLDAEVVRREGQVLLASVAEVLKARTNALSGDLAKTMAQYFDPASGTLPQRLEQLVKSGGQIETLLDKHVGGDQSAIAQTLAKHVGEHSDLFKLLSPKQSDGLLATLAATLEKALEGQRKAVLDQFSLDSKDSALSRLLAELTSSNGKLRGDLSEDVTRLVREFSLDNQDGALSRLVQRVEKAQRTITEEFSLDRDGSALQRLSNLLEKTNGAVQSSLTLDDEKSPLARLKREILDVLEQQSTANANFQKEVRSTLEVFQARRAEAARGTQHGVSFEDTVGDFLQLECNRLGDLCEPVGKTVGKHGKVGDHLVEMGPESGAPGARIVYEAKANKRYTIKMALAELESARENREAQVGVFVFNRDSAPKNLDPVHRVGGDLLVIWDADDAATDMYLKLGISVARALAQRVQAESSESDTDRRQLEELIDRIAKHATALEAIEAAARTTKKNGEKILHTAEQMREALEQQVEELRLHVAALG
jgi:hypothetical protein